MGGNLLMTVFLGVVFLALVFWVAVRLRQPRRREEQPQPGPPPVEARRPEPQPEPPPVEARPEPQPAPPVAIDSPPAALPTPMPEFDAADIAAVERQRIEPAAPPQAGAAPEPVAQVAPPTAVEPAEPEVIASPPEPAAAAEPPAQVGPSELSAPPAPHASPAPDASAPPVEPGSPARAEAAAVTGRAKRRPASKRKAPGGGPRQAQILGVPALFHEAYRNIRTWTASLAPGRALPPILTDPEVDRGDPTTYRFRLRQRPYAIVKSDLTERDAGVGPLLHEKVQLLDGEGATLFEMSILTADIGSDETPGEIAAFIEGPWLDDFRELNALSSRDSKRIGTDFRKKFRAKEQVRLKRDFGV